MHKSCTTHTLNKLNSYRIHSQFKHNSNRFHAYFIHNSYIFHAGTVLKNNKIFTAGGRVLGATAKGESLKIAQERAYALVQDIEFNGMQYRTDIGQKALKKVQ